MTCEEVQPLLTDYIDHELSDVSRYAVETHIRTCDTCAAELKKMQLMLEQISEEKEHVPPDSLRQRFNAMLQSELNLQATQNILAKQPKAKIFSLQPSSPIWKMAAACLIFIAGLWLGGRTKNPPAPLPTEQISEMKQDLKDVKETLMLTLLKDESASERIKAVSYAEDMAHPDQNVMRALISTLNNDKNVNVRLASLFSLGKFTDDRQVRDSLVESLGRQTEPIIQIALINILVEKNEPKAIRPMRELLSNRNTHEQVKQIARKGLREL